mgnify:FL=1
MWLLHFLPDAYLAFIVDAVLILGVAATVLTCFLLKYVVRLMPALAPHVFLAQAVSIAVLLAGVYFKGGYATEMIWRERVAEVQEQLKEAQQQSNRLNDELDAMAKKKVQYIRGRTEYITRYIEKDVAKYDDRFSKNGMCAIPQEFVKAHNDAARRPQQK